LSGRAALRIGVVLVLVGAAFDSPSLYVPGVALAILSLGSGAWVRLAARSARLQRLPGPWSVVEGEPYPLALRIQRGRFPAPGGRLEDPYLGRSPALGMRFPGQLSLEARFARRGRRELEPATLRIGDPLGLRSAEVRSGGEVEVLVLPRIEPVVASADGGAGAEEERPHGSQRGIGGSGLHTGAVEFEVDGLRPYRDGSPASRIHWPTVARTGELLEHKLVTGGQASPLVVLDAADPADEDSLDDAVRAAASLCFHLARAGGCAALLPGEARLRTIDSGLRAWPGVHARLALVEPDRAATRMRRWPRGELVFWVTARAQAALPWGRMPAGARGFLVTPAPVAGLRSAFTVAGCHGQRLDVGAAPNAVSGKVAAAA
jgi:uncharacterized protein (DUF58 family)